MKRDIDLCRQLLFDLEAHGPECAVNILRAGPTNEVDERIHFHLRLLIDAGLAKEVDRTTGGLSCVRLTNAGVELIELCRSDARWRDAKALVLEQTGGLSLTVIRTVLTKWAVESAGQGGYRRPRRVYRTHHRYIEPRSRYRPYRYESDYLYADGEFRSVRSQPDYREEFDWNEPVYDTPVNGYRAEPVDAEVGVSLPIYLV